MAKVIESSEFLYSELSTMAGGFSALERAAERITMHNVQMRSFLLRLVDPEDLGHAVTNEVMALASGLLTMEQSNGRS